MILLFKFNKDFLYSKLEYSLSNPIQILYCIGLKTP